MDRHLSPSPPKTFRSSLVSIAVCIERGTSVFRFSQLTIFSEFADDCTCDCGPNQFWVTSLSLFSVARTFSDSLLDLGLVCRPLTQMTSCQRSSLIDQHFYF